MLAYNAETEKNRIREEVEEARAELEAYPEMIFRQKELNREAREKVETATIDVSLYEADLMVDISAEVDEKGKAVFSNEKTRQAELLRRSSTDAEYQTLKKALQEKERELNRGIDMLDRAYDEFRAVRYQTNLLIAEMEFLAKLS